MLNRRLQVLVSDARFEQEEGERAGRELLAPAPPSETGPEPDWEDQKREMLNALVRRWPGA